MPAEQDRLRVYLELLRKAHGDLGQQIANASGRKKQSGSGLESVFSTFNAEETIYRLDAGADMSAEQASGLEAIIDEDLRPAIDIVGGTFAVSHPLWSKLSENSELKERIERVIPSVGRIGLPGNKRLPYAGTGFVVGKRLLMTNRHLAQIFTNGLGNRLLDFLPGVQADVDFLREVNGSSDVKPLEVMKTVMVHPYWDMAILEVDGLEADHPVLELAVDDARQFGDAHEIFVIGYPAFDPRNPLDAQKKVFQGKYGVKRLQPGALHGRADTASFGKIVAALGHDCSTLGGNSGSAIFDLSTGQVLGLHFGGQYHLMNYAVPSYELSRDSRVVDAGVKFSGDGAASGTGDWSSWWVRADRNEAATAREVDHSHSAASKPAGSDVRMVVSGNQVRVEIPLVITVSLGRQGQPVEIAASTTTTSDEFEEALREPFRDGDYGQRKGYDPNFLNERDAKFRQLTISLPRARDSTILATTKDGSNILKYEHFSIAVHAKRRIALFTASNVVSAPELKRPERGKNYSRRGLSGLGPNDQEKWFLDPRIDPIEQLPDVFFNKDRQAFDKGHIVRRDDVAWGETYEELRRANGDTYHVTNCSPQVKEFNRSNLGDANWGDLENSVLSEAASERLCVFSGPVLKEGDRVFTGVGDGSSMLRARIPAKFWKIVIARTAEGCAAYGFVLEQDLSDVEWEFTVSEDMIPFMYPIKEITEMTEVEFDPVIVENDQFATTRGEEISMRSGARRRPRKR
jgi:endonuclease G, mitochondrial